MVNIIVTFLSCDCRFAFLHVSSFCLKETLEYGMEKLCRGLALGIALTVYGREEEADTLIEQMTRDQDPILRYGGMYALALAYRGTSNNKAIRRLLHFAVSDVSDDVRRTAVLALGFVLYSEPEQVCFLQYPIHPFLVRVI